MEKPLEGSSQRDESNEHAREITPGAKNGLRKLILGTLAATAALTAPETGEAAPNTAQANIGGVIENAAQGV
jgi:hypothetical protein